MNTPNPWFRHYVGMVADPKFGGIARRTKETRERIVFIWSYILESASHVNDGGKFLFDIDVVADLLRCENDSIETILTQLESCGLIEGRSVVKWHSRQYLSDNSTERSRKHREKKRASGSDASGNGDATLRNVAATEKPVAATPPESESDTEKEKKQRLSVSGGVGEKGRTDVRFFFELTPERRAQAAALGFGDMVWVEAETARFIDRNQGKRVKHPDKAWIAWMTAGQAQGIDNTPAPTMRHGRAEFPLAGRPHL